MRNFRDVLDIRDWAAAGVSLENFSAPEDGFVWQTGRWGEIVFPFDESGAVPGSSLVTGPPGMAELMLEADVFRHEPGLPGQDLFVYLNGLRIGSFFVTHRRILIMPVPLGTLRAANNVLTLEAPGAAPPQAYGVEDGRVLGTAVFAVYFRRAS